jgi:two-component system, NtrC family, sensor kinase
MHEKSAVIRDETAAAAAHAVSRHERNAPMTGGDILHDSNPDGPVAAAPASRLRLAWQVKAVLPIAFVLLNGLLLLLLATLSVTGPQRHAVLVVAATGAVAICAVLFSVLYYLVQRPMVQLQDKMERVISAGDLTVAVPFANRNDEIGDLGRNFNEMIRRLRESQEEIDRLHRTQMSRAEHLATLGELAAGLAHEIRNPLAGIAGVIDIIGRDLPPSSPARQVVKEVRQEVTHINRIISDLLETARPKPPEIRRSDLNATAEHSVMFGRQQALSRSIAIEFIPWGEPLEVEHDAAQIHQVLLNLLLNSIQAIGSSGQVRVQILAANGHAKVLVEDSGPGIAPEHLPNIFRPFYTTKGNGTGLGLSLARRIVEEHGGRIEVSSQPAHGAVFEVVLPLHQSRGQAAD